MNELLFMLWMGDISNNVSFMLGFGGFFTTMALVAVWFIRGEYADIPFPTKYVAVTFCAMLLGTLIPSKQFFYIAAGGTAAVQALDTEIGKKVAKLVELKLNEALGETK